VNNLFAYSVKFLRAVRTDACSLIHEIRVNEILNYHSQLTEHDRWHLLAVSGLVQRWRSFGLPGVLPDAVELLKRMKIRGNQKGEAVLTADPYTVAFSETEFQALHAGLRGAYEREVITTERFLLAWLFLAFGQRPVQYAALKVCDLWYPRPRTARAGSASLAQGRGQDAVQLPSGIQIEKLNLQADLCPTALCEPNASTYGAIRLETPESRMATDSGRPG
jgi:hypothetical protein